MYRRFLIATLLIATSAIVTLGVPFGFVFTHLIRNEAVRSADERAGSFAAAVDTQLRNGDTITRLSIAGYNPAGQLLEITPANQPTITIGDINTTDIVWSRPITSELGAQIRVGITETSLKGLTNRAWLLVAALSAGGIAVALALATILARRTSRPFTAVAATAHRLASGDFSARSPQDSGIGELDGIAQAINSAAGRIAQLVAAERRFTLDASHQLRTPLTSLAIRLEEIVNTNSLATAHREATAAIGHADRLLESITDLLAISRRQRNETDSTTVDINALARDHVKLFEPVIRKAHRTINIDSSGNTTIHCSTGAVGQALNVLLDNAVAHGIGPITVDVEAAGNGVRIRVGDQGTTHTTPDTTDTNTALGLALARTLINAEGGHLTLLTTPHTTYELFLPHRRPPAADDRGRRATEI